jgi:hypothetical protein
MMEKVLCLLLNPSLPYLRADDHAQGRVLR